MCWWMFVLAKFNTYTVALFTFATVGFAGGILVSVTGNILRPTAVLIPLWVTTAVQKTTLHTSEVPETSSIHLYVI